MNKILKGFIGIFFLISMIFMAIYGKVLHKLMPYNHIISCSKHRSPLFSARDPHDFLEIELQADFNRINKRPVDRAYSRGKITIYPEKNVSKKQTIPIRLEARGVIRFKHCEFRPLKLILSDNQKGTIFSLAGRKTKIVTHCGVSKGSLKSQDRRVLMEYYIYKILQTLNTSTFDTRLLKIHYKDKNGKHISDNLGFFIETKRSLAQRCNLEIAHRKDLINKKLLRKKVGYVSQELKYTETSILQAKFLNYFIFDEDYQIYPGHNITPLKTKNGEGIAIPYDYDETSLVGKWDHPYIFYKGKGIGYLNWLKRHEHQKITLELSLAVLKKKDAILKIIKDSLMDELGKEIFFSWHDEVIKILTTFLKEANDQSYFKKL